MAYPASLQDWRYIWQASQRVLVVLCLSFCAATPEAARAAQIRLTWQNNADSAEGFKLERRTGTAGSFTLIATQGAQLNSYSDRNLEPQTQYCYRVKAYNSIGESGYSNETCVTTTSLETAFESPEDGQVVAGIAVLRGWAFDIYAGRQVSTVEILVDGKSLGTSPCCSPRGDVQAAFPRYPPQNTVNSGWATVLNWGLFSSGSHTVQVKLTSQAGETIDTDLRVVTVVRAGDYEFLDQFSLSQAAVWIEGEELVVKEAIVRDSASQQQKKITARFRWSPAMQSLALATAETVSQVFSLRSLLSFSWPVVTTWIQDGSLVTSVQAASGILALLESPAAGQVVSGVNVLRGWAFSEEPGTTVREVRVSIDGQFIGTAPCCAQREDVAAAFPGDPNARQSGWGMTVNYGNLSSGSHTLSTQIVDSRGSSRSLESNFQVVRIGDFAFLDTFMLSGATARIEGDDIVVSGVHVHEKTSDHTHVVTVRLRWMQNSQMLSIVASKQ